MLEEPDLDLAQAPMHTAIMYARSALNEIGQDPVRLVVLPEPLRKVVGVGAIYDIQLSRYDICDASDSA